MTDRQGRCSYRAVMMGTDIEIQLTEHNPQLARQLFAKIKQLEDLLTVNRPDSQLMAVNRAAGKHPVVVDRQVFSLTETALQVSLQGGCFNLAIGPLVKRWKIGFGGDSLPPATEIKALLALTDPRAVIADRDSCSLFLTLPGMEIDVGAIAKGYIADVLCECLRVRGVRNAMINLGGNIRVMGSPDGSLSGCWNVGVRQPFSADGALCGVITLANRSVVTSGVGERFFVYQGRHYHHILDPRTGYPLDNDLLSVTVISECSTDGEIYSSQLYGMGLQAACDWLVEHPAIEALFITRDGQIVCPSQRQFSFRPLTA
ncbi:FAD:protein FMN transferase [Tatumella citrea]|uniref:FAD:protein FMN transferase n=1 Tax=Tatumella citrea TaxID=53336 RepID=A0A1Y0L4V0_TATCI|nr:FAD:protein FMN transferase [Tatumella citrea]ARU92708.1 thiamine biosynthesis protein ApbE [Tatumella citrea]ARU96745.1 thiamine biosynthesis protein ApbE [Tatumella citrea]